MSSKAKKVEMKDKPQVLRMAGGVGIALAITCIVFIAYALILTYTDISEKYISVVSVICTIVSAAVAGFDSAKYAEKRGMVWGIGAGIIYALVLFVICTFVGQSFDMARLITFLVAGAAGGVGGIFGINVK